MHLPQKLALFALAIAVLFDILFHSASNIGINLFLAECVFLGGSLMLARQTKHPVPHSAWIAATFAAAYSATFAIWTSNVGLFVSLVGFLSSNFLFAAFLLGHQPHFRHPLEILWNGTVDVGYKILSRLNIFSSLKPKGINVRQSTVLKGLIIALPLLFIFALLFASADPIFAHYADAILFDWIDTITFSRILSHAIFIGFFAAAFLLFFAAAYWERFTLPASSKQIQARFESESVIVVGSIVALFGSFLLLQARTLLGGQIAWESTGLTYAQYAREGFTQLIIVSILVLAVILTLRMLHGTFHKATNTLHLVLLGETALVLISAVRRLSLYVDVYGYTPSRLFAYWMMLVVAVLIGILVVNIVWKEDQSIAMQRGLIALGVLGFLFTASAPDALSASLNIQRAQSGGRPVDIQMLLDLSPEAASVIYAGLSNQPPIDGIIPGRVGHCGPADSPPEGWTRDQKIRKQIKKWYGDHLPKEIDDTTLKPLSGTNDWQSWNLSRALLQKAGATQPIPDWITQPDADAGIICG